MEFRLPRLERFDPSMRRKALVGLLVSIGINSFSPIAQSIAVAPWGNIGLSLGLLQMSYFLMLPWLGSVAGLLFGALFLIPGRSRKKAMAGCFFMAIYSATGFLCFGLGDWLRGVAFQGLAGRSAALVATIKDYEERHGAPPAQLQALVPAFIKGIPATGMGAYPEFEYVVGEEARKYYEGNPWVLVVQTPTGVLNWDKFVYFPMQNYPERGYGGVIKKFRDWAYVYE